MHETYRMLGEAHEDDLAREARSRRLAAIARAEGPVSPPKPRVQRRRTWLRMVPRLTLRVSRS